MVTSGADLSVTSASHKRTQLIMRTLDFVKTATKNFLRRHGLEVSRIHRSKQAQELAIAKAAEFVRAMSQVNLELGAGPVKGKNGWVTIDHCEGTNITWDLNMPLPFPDESVSKIYSSHLLEHFFYPDLMRLLVDCHRVLKPGGSFSACVPDASIYVRAYMNAEALDRSFLGYRPAVVSDCKMDWLNYIAYMDGHHRYMFDGENLLRVLTKAGFSDVRGRDFDPVLDMLERKYQSIYAVGTKPQ
jgi:predicted SAM-dependent methyltransferase